MKKNKLSKTRIAICIFGCSRFDNLKKILVLIQKSQACAGLNLYIFIDRPINKINLSEHKKIISLLRNKKYAQKNIFVIINKKNFGIKKQIIKKLSTVFKKNKAAIVIEDDIIPSCHFFSFLIKSLVKFQNANQVCQISGFLPAIRKIKLKNAFFLPVTTSWGWGTWSDRWSKFLKFLNSDYQSSIKSLNKNRFNINNNYPFYKILKIQSRSSWAILWYLFNFLEQRLVLYPPRPLVFNSGFDPSASNCRFSFIAQNLNQKNCKNKIKLPKKICTHKQTMIILKAYRPKLNFNQIPQAIYEKIKRILS